MTAEPLPPTELAAGSLRLRPWLPRDAEEVHEICQDPDIQRWTRVPSPYTREAARSFVEEVSPTGWSSGSDACFAVLDSTDGRVLASTALMHLDRSDRRGEVGLWTAPWARGQGITTQATQVLCRWGFGALRLQRIEWLASPGNVASIRVAEKVGFVAEGIARNRLDFRGEQVDAWVGALVPADLDRT